MFGENFMNKILIFILFLLLTSCENREEINSTITVEIKNGYTWDLPENTTKANNTGIFKMYGQTVPSKYNDANFEFINSIGLTYNWKAVQDDESVYNFSKLIENINIAKQMNKKVILRFKHHEINQSTPWTSGESYVPDWVLTEETPKFYTHYENENDFIQIAAPWDEKVQNGVLNLIKEICLNILLLDNVAGIYFHGFSTSAGEEFWLDDYYLDEAENAGMTKELLEKTYTERFDKWNEFALGNQGKIVFVTAEYMPTKEYRNVMDNLNKKGENYKFGLRVGGNENYKAAFSDSVRYGNGDWGLNYNETTKKITIDENWPLRDEKIFLGSEDEQINSGEEYKTWFEFIIFIESFLQTRYLWVKDDDDFLQNHNNLLKWFSLTAGKPLNKRKEGAVWFSQISVRNLSDSVNPCRFIENIEIGITQTNETKPDDLFNRSDLSNGSFYGDCNLNNESVRYDYFAKSTDVENGIYEFDLKIDENLFDSLNEKIIIEIVYFDVNNAIWGVFFDNKNQSTIENVNTENIKTVKFKLNKKLIKNNQFKIKTFNNQNIKLRLLRIMNQ